MKIKNNKGITMISLVIMVLLMILLASITAYEANGLISISRVQSVTTDLLLIQAKVRIINEKEVFEKDEEKSWILGDKLSEHTDILSVLKEKNIISSDETVDNYYLLSQQNLNDMGLESLNYADGYVVNYETEDVIYVKGVKNKEGKYLYRLKDMKP